MTKVDIITRNFFKMMRSGALNEYVEMEPMSAFKWNRLVEIVLSQDVVTVASRATKNHQYDATFNMPQDMRERIHAEADNRKTPSIRLELNNRMLNSKLTKIQIAERHAADFSQETLNMFNLLMANCQAILDTGNSTWLIIRLGNYMRINNDKIDYKKVSRWLQDMQMTKVARLVGSVLITNFSFKPEEVPFVKKVDQKAALVMMQSIMSRKKEKHNSGITYFEYAPLENISIILDRLKNNLDKIEE